MVLVGIAEVGCALVDLGEANGLGNMEVFLSIYSWSSADKGVADTG